MPAMKKIKNKLIYNTGDQIESMTCIVENVNGKFELIYLNKIL